MTVDEVNKLIEGWTQAERQDICGALTKLSVGTIKIDDVTNTWMQMLKADSIPAKCSQAVQSRVYIPMKPAKLVILQPQFEQVEYEDIIERREAKIEKTWWRTRVVTAEVRIDHRIEHKRVVTVPRAIWRIRAAFVGAAPQFPIETDISGDMFGPDGTLAFGSMLQPGLDVTLQVENTTSQAMPFYAVLLGRGVKLSPRKPLPPPEAMHGAADEFSGKDYPAPEDVT